MLCVRSWIMKEILDFLAECKVFFLATAEAEKPHVRAMGLFFEHNGKLCFGTSNRKPLWKQVKANPNIEICAWTGTKWLRLAGKVAFDPGKEYREKALEAMPSLKSRYAVDDGIFEIFYFESACGAFEDLAGEKKEVSI